jgi:hypothetical protein
MKSGEVEKAGNLNIPQGFSRQLPFESSSALKKRSNLVQV